MTLPVIDQPAFDKLECNRCGACCERFFLNGLPGPKGPLGFLQRYAQYEETEMFGPQDSMLFFGQLVASWDEGREGWTYACGHFQRDADGLGVCTIYEDRPAMCSEFPYGRPASGFDTCVWNVELLDFEVVQGAY